MRKVVSGFVDCRCWSCCRWREVSSAQTTEPLVIGLMVDQSGALTIYGYEEEYGFKLGLLYAAGVDPADYDNNMDKALAAVTDCRTSGAGRHARQRQRRRHSRQPGA